MTRQEQKAVKELSAMISKNTKVIAKEHGFKVVSDCAYKVLGDFLYEVFLSAPPIRRGTAIRAVVSVKPCVIDNVFWDAYEMGEVARKKPFSFHITAAHSPSAHIIEEMELPVPTVDAATLVMNEVFCRFNKSIQDHHSRCSTVSDFKAEILHDTAPTARLNVVLCEIAEGNFRQAVLLAEKELENEPYGLFKAMRELAAKNLIELANNWLSQDEENPRNPETDPITEDELARRISLTSLSVTSGGSFTAWFDCDEMFTDHAVTVYGSLKKGLKAANIEG